MPIFEYICKDCNHFFEALVYSSEPGPEGGCPKCKSNNLEKQLSLFGVKGGSGSSSGSCSSCSGGNCSTCR